LLLFVFIYLITPSQSRSNDREAAGIGMAGRKRLPTPTRAQGPCLQPRHRARCHRTPRDPSEPLQHEERVLAKITQQKTRPAASPHPTQSQGSSTFLSFAGNFQARRAPTRSGCLGEILHFKYSQAFFFLFLTANRF